MKNNKKRDYNSNTDDVFVSSLINIKGTSQSTTDPDNMRPSWG